MPLPILAAPNKHLREHDRCLQEGQEQSSEEFYIQQSPLKEVSTSPAKSEACEIKKSSNMLLLGLSRMKP